VKKLYGIRRAWNQMLEAGCKPNKYIISYYIDALAKAGCHEEAMAVFQEMQDAGRRPNIFTYSVVIHSLVEALKLEAACELYERMTTLSFTPNSATYSALVKAHAKGVDMEKAVFFYREMMDAGLTPSQSLRSLLSEALTSQGRANEAEELTHISAAMAVANMRNKELEAALHGSLLRPERLAELLRDWGRETELALERVKLKMRHPYILNVLTLVSDDPEVAWRYFEWVRAQESYNPTRHMFARVLDIVGKAGHRGLQKEIISEAERLVEGNAVTYENVINSYCVSKHTDAALRVSIACLSCCIACLSLLCMSLSLHCMYLLLHCMSLLLHCMSLLLHSCLYCCIACLCCCIESLFCLHFCVVSLKSW
jgi:pentatricopeptide repeat protein